MKTMTLEKQILERIRNEGVRPTPRGVFRARDYVLWGLLGLFVAALSVGVGMVIYMARSADLDLMTKLGFSAGEKVLYAVPFFWIIATLAVGGVAYYNFRRTRRGYRVSGLQFGIISGAVALAFGSLVYAFNVAERVDQAASSAIPVYNTLAPLNTRNWFDPAHGLISGMVKEKFSNDHFILRDQSFNLWTVTGTDVSLMPADFNFKTGDYVKIIGRQTGSSTFDAVEIRPFETELRKPLSPIR